MPPKQATPRDPSRPTDAASGAFVAHCHDRPWSVWQRAAADVIGEHAGDGRYAYPIVVVEVPRQVGKTTWCFDLAQGRCLDQVDYRAAYTAQTGHVVTERMAERMGELSVTPLAGRVTSRRSQGTERMSFPRGSYVKAFPPRDGALRGSALDLVIVDEAQEIDDDQGQALDRTILPTFTTRPRRQLILIGTAGTDSSAYFSRYLTLARAGAPGVALVEYAADPDDDPTDETVWARVHPGLAHGLTDLDALRSALAVLGPANFAREYLCVWQSTTDRVVPAAAWTAIRHRDATADMSVPPVLAVDVAVDRSAAAVVACWPTRDGVPVVEVVEYAPGAGWAAGLIQRIRAQQKCPVVMADSSGPVLTVVDELTALGIPVESTTTREFTAACAGFLDQVVAGAVWHRGEPALDTAAAGAGRRAIGDGWGWARRSSTGDVSPLVAASLALWAHRHRPTPKVRPRVVSLPT